MHTLDEVQQADHRRADKFPSRGVPDDRAQLDDFGLAVAHQDKRTAHRAHVQRLEVLIQDEDAPIHLQSPAITKTDTSRAGEASVGTSRYCIAPWPTIVYPETHHLVHSSPN